MNTFAAHFDRVEKVYAEIQEYIHGKHKIAVYELYQQVGPLKGKNVKP